MSRVVAGRDQRAAAPESDPDAAVALPGAVPSSQRTAEQEEAAESQPDAEQEAREEEQRLVANATSLKLGCTQVKWIPWPQCPEEQWVPIRTCSMPELDQAYLLGHQRCAELKRIGDEKLFERWETYAILWNALRKGLAYQEGLNPDGSIKLRIVKSETNFDEPLFSSPNDLRQSIRDKAMLDELIGYYYEHSLTAAPLSTYRRLLREQKFVEFAKALKKKPGPINLEGFSAAEMEGLIVFLVNSLRLGGDTSTPA